MSDTGEAGRIRHTVTEDEAGTRLDILLTEIASAALGREISRAQVVQWIDQGRVSIGSKVCERASFKPKSGMVIVAERPPVRTLELLADSEIPLAIVFEDDDLIVLDKQPGLSVHPGAGQHSGTLVNALLHHLGPKLCRIGDALRPGIVHRLDKDTSGLLVVAKTERAFRSLRRQLKPPRTMGRKYLALTYSLPRRGEGSVVSKDRESGMISLPIGRHPQVRVKMAVVKRGGKDAVSHWKLVESFRTGALLEVSLETGRTHQIRVHLSHAGASIVGDPVYGTPHQRILLELRRAADRFRRQALHAAELSFLHPETNRVMSFRCPLPKDFQDLLNTFRGAGGASFE